MFRIILALSVISILFVSPFASTAQVNTSNDSDLFALPKKDLSAEIAAAKVEADRAKASRIAAEGRADAAEGRADAAEGRADAAREERIAAETAAKSLEDLANRNVDKPSEDASDLFALPTEKKLSLGDAMATADERLAGAKADRIAAEGRVEAAEGRVEAAEGRVEAAEGRVEAAEGRVEAAEAEATAIDRIIEGIDSLGSKK